MIALQRALTGERGFVELADKWRISCAQGGSLDKTHDLIMQPVNVLKLAQAMLPSTASRNSFNLGKPPPCPLPYQE
jgi:hypothetical protein